MIELLNVSKSYHSEVKAVDNINLTIPDGRIFGFLGPNGAGKTTTIKMITGILSPDSGDILLQGNSIINNALAAKRCFGLVPDDPNVFPRLRGLEYLKFMGDVYQVPTEQRTERIASLAKRLSLTDALGERIQSYSHGMRQKLMIIGALLHAPDVWILDEPMTGLDPQSAFELKNMMREHADKGKTVFFSTHVLEVAERICDDLAVIDQGQIRFSGTLEQMREQSRADESLESMFLRLVAEGEKS
jgi:ABC-2 type transport system ATP-binding protein